MLKTSVIPALFDCLRHVLEKSPELIHPVAEAGLAAGAAAALAPAAIPLAIAGPTIVEQYARHRENRPDPAALAELFRKSLLKAVEELSRDRNKQFSELDQGLLELWAEGLSAAPKDNPYWARMLDEEIPDEVTRLIGIAVADAPSNWPALRALLERWTDWFRYRRITTATTIVAAPPRQPLVLSAYAERFFAVNLTTAFLEEFSKDLTSGHQVVAFRQTVLEALAQLGRDLAPPDPLKAVGKLPSVADVDTEVQLLNARYRAVPYIGREDDLNALFAWLDDRRAVSFQAVAGRGGSGKTRLAYRFLELLEERAPYRWHAGLLDLSESPNALARERFQKWRGQRPTLIVIDYAAAHAEELADGIGQLYKSTMSARKDDAPLRFLLLERSADEQQGWYKNLRAAARDRVETFFPNERLRLGDLDAGQRVALLDAGLEAAYAFDRKRNSAGRPRLPLPAVALMAARLNDKKMEDPLVLLMAALVAHSRQDLAPLNLDRMELAKIVAGRERLRIESLAGRTHTPFLPLHLAAYVTLTGRLTFAELESAWEEEAAALRETSWQRHELIDLLARRAIPAADSGFAVEPIVPDVVGESFVMDVLREREHHAQEAIPRAAARKPGPVARALVRMVQDFAPAAGAAKSLEQEWALDLLTRLLTSRTEALRDSEFWEIHQALPVDTIAMRRPARDFYRAVLEAKVKAGDQDRVWLTSLEWFAVYAGAMGQRTEALRSIAEAVGIRRKLAEANADAFLPALASSLNNQSNRQSAMGQRAEALRSIAEAVAIRRNLAEANAEAFLPALATSLNNQSNRQSEMGQRAEALRSIAEAVAIRRNLAEANAEAFLPALATSLNNQSNRQSEMGQRADALRSIGEAVEIYRKLAEANADAFLPDLASSLNNQSAMQSAMGQRAEALRSIAEAVAIYRKLAEANADAFLPDLASSLNNQSNRQSAMGQRAEALRSIAEAVAIYRKLAEANADAFLPDLASSLNNQSNRQSEMGQRAEALRSIAEAVAIYRKLAEANADAFLPDLASSLNNQSNRQSEMGQRAEALRSIAEAVAIYRKLAEANADAFLPALATSLNNQSTMRSEMGQRAEALRSIAEAVAIYRKLAEANADAFLPALAMSLNNQSNMQSEMGQRAEALRSIAEAVGIRRKLAEANADAFLPDLASSLHNQSTMQSAMGQRAEALRSIAEAVAIYRKLAEANADAFLPDLAMSLNNQSTMQSAMGQRADALRSIAEAVEIYRKLAEANADAFLPNLAASLNNQSTMQSAMGQRADALRSIAEAVAIRRKLAEANADAFLPNLATSHYAWAQILTESAPAEAAEKFGEGIRIIAPFAARLPQAFLPLGLRLARGYLGACEAAGIELDPEIFGQIEMFVRLKEEGD